MAKISLLYHSYEVKQTQSPTSIMWSSVKFVIYIRMQDALLALTLMSMIKMCQTVFARSTIENIFHVEKFQYNMWQLHCKVNVRFHDKVGKQWHLDYYKVIQWKRVYYHNWLVVFFTSNNESIYSSSKLGSLEAFSS